MARRYEFRDSLLIQIGRIATLSAYIEQEIILWTSALASQDTGGRPIEWLRMDFKRLREKWFGLAKKRNDMKTHDIFLLPLNDDLAKHWVIRRAMIHGKWFVIGRGRYEINWWEQKDMLRPWRMKSTLSGVRNFANSLFHMLGQIDEHHRSYPAPKPYMRHPGNLVPRRTTRKARPLRGTPSQE
jgi:hypothetical protein